MRCALVRGCGSALQTGGGKAACTRWFAIVAVASVTCRGAVYGQTFQELYAFEVFGNGDDPWGGLIQATDGSFYGTTFYGGKWDFGTVFKITPDGILTTLASFDATNTDQHPVGALVEASDSNFYGITDSALFRVTPAGTLTRISGGGAGSRTDGLVQGTNGYLYGTDAHYGAILWSSLDGYTDGGVSAPGSPTGGLIQARDGNFYGVTGNGGATGSGTAYRMTPGGLITVLASFPYDYGGPRGRLLETDDGDFLGYAGWGSYGAGVIFRLTPQGALTTVASFNFDNGKGPVGGLIQANDGSFYGTTEHGGTNCCPSSLGTVFRMTPDGVITALVSFSGGEGPFPGANPEAGLVQGSDGNLYGTTSVQGSRGAGNVFRIIMPGPKIDITNMAGQAVISWRTNYAGFILQSSQDLNPGSWLDGTNLAFSASGRFWVTNPISSGSQFFRLKK
jgi:uncharacterized repeat protein (TIGR03803 family)